MPNAETLLLTVFRCSALRPALGWGASSDLDGSTWTPNMGETDSVVKHDPDTFVDLHNDNNVMDSTIEGTGEDAAVWFMERVCVQLNKNSAQAVIKEINGSQAVVEFEDKSTQTVRNGEVTMVPPQEHDMVLVTGGAGVGFEGELVCIDRDDAILKDTTEGFRIFDYIHLAKITSR
jgi:transcription elongation factor SPT5